MSKFVTITSGGYIGSQIAKTVGYCISFSRFYDVEVAETTHMHRPLLQFTLNTFSTSLFDK